MLGALVPVNQRAPVRNCTRKRWPNKQRLVVGDPIGRPGNRRSGRNPRTGRPSKQQLTPNKRTKPTDPGIISRTKAILGSSHIHRRGTPAHQVRALHPHIGTTARRTRRTTVNAPTKNRRDLNEDPKAQRKARAQRGTDRRLATILVETRGGDCAPASPRQSG